MNFEELIKNIKNIYRALTGKDVDVILSYKGFGAGRTKPWHLRIDNREKDDVSYQNAAQELFLELKDELAHKASSLEKQAVEYRKTLSLFAN